MTHCGVPLTPLANRPFPHSDPVWLVDYCKRCGHMNFYLRSPVTGPITEDQPV